MAVGDVIDEKLQDIFNKFPGVFEVIFERKKVVCKLTNHELPFSLIAVQGYVEGKKFKRLASKVKSPENVLEKMTVKYKEYFVQSKKSKSCLFCTLTKKEVNKLPHELEKYINGYKFRKAFFNRNNTNNESSSSTKSTDQGDGNEDLSEDDDVEIPDFAISSDEEDSMAEETKLNEKDEKQMEVEEQQQTAVVEVVEKEVKNKKRKKEILNDENKNMKNPKKKKKKTNNILLFVENARNK